MCGIGFLLEILQHSTTPYLVSPACLPAPDPPPLGRGDSPDLVPPLGAELTDELPQLDVRAGLCLS